MARNVTPSDPVLINENRLDRECLDQPRRVREAGEAVAEARHKHSQAKAKVDLTEAELRLKILTTPSDWDGASMPEKLTVDVITSLVVTHKDYQEAIADLGQKKYELDLEEALLSGLHHRKGMLEKLIELLAMEYRSDPKMSGGAEVRRHARDAARAEGDGVSMPKPARNGLLKKKKKKIRP